MDRLRAEIDRELHAGHSREVRSRLRAIRGVLPLLSESSAIAALLMGAMVARAVGRWDLVSRRSIDALAIRGSLAERRAIAMLLLGSCADAHHRWKDAQHARRQVRRMVPAGHLLWWASRVEDLEQAVRRRNQTAIAQACRALKTAGRLPTAFKNRMKAALEIGVHGYGGEGGH